MMKNFKSRFFEDYFVGDEINHSVPRTVSEGDVAIYLATTGSRFAVNYSKEFSKAIGYEETPIDDILMFHIVFGRTVPDLSLNAIANLGYAGVKIHKTCLHWRYIERQIKSCWRKAKLKRKNRYSVCRINRCKSKR